MRTKVEVGTKLKFTDGRVYGKITFKEWIEQTQQIIVFNGNKVEVYNENEVELVWKLKLNRSTYQINQMTASIYIDDYLFGTFDIKVGENMDILPNEHIIVDYDVNVKVDNENIKMEYYYDNERIVWIC